MKDTRIGTVYNKKLMLSETLQHINKKIFKMYYDVERKSN